MSKDEKRPLADRMRPRNLSEFFGQENVVGKGKLLERAIATDNVPSILFWGPPGTGKTTLALIVAEKTRSDFVQISAVTSGLKDLRQIIKRAGENKAKEKRTILFIDEIHRWNKSQQDALLPHVEAGTITLIGATTENPSFTVRGALLSRCRVITLERLSEEHIQTIVKNALVDKERGLGRLGLAAGKNEVRLIAEMSNGDARNAINALEYASTISQELSPEIIREAYQKSYLMYDKDGEEHYNIISALHKSMRGSDPDAALYWLARMTEAGEDPLYIARRLVRFASEDIGLANSRALEQATAAYQACHFIGLPECNVILAQAVVYMAKCPKSNELYTAYSRAAGDAREYGNLGVPLHLRNAPTKLMKDLGYGKDYKYSPDFDYKENQDYLPPELKGRKYLKK